MVDCLLKRQVHVLAFGACAIAIALALALAMPRGIGFVALALAHALSLALAAACMRASGPRSCLIACSQERIPRHHCAWARGAEGGTEARA
eukprot:74691-Pyramimonas_sp.AAC.1